MRTLAESGFRYGIEHEIPLLKNRQFVDFSNTHYEDLAPIIFRLPTYDEDYPMLRIGDLGIKAKRWYIEGFERFSESGDYLRTDIKGVEIRTPIMSSIKGAVDQLKADFDLFCNEAAKDGYRPTAIALNPFQSEFVPDPPLNTKEIEMRHSPEERTAYIHMLTYGPDVSLSHPQLTIAELIDVGQKLTYYSPFIVPFSFSSPFYQNKLWEGLSRRTYYRTGQRPAALVFLANSDDIIASAPSLTEPARIAAEVGRIEFKAFDACDDLNRYGSFLALIKGMILDTSLPGRRLTPDLSAHQHSARVGFHDEGIRSQAKQVLGAACAALTNADEHSLLEPLVHMLEAKRSPADSLIDSYHSNHNIINILEKIYDS